jgi:transcriptional regulator with XRE-family HTH domain
MFATVYVALMKNEAGIDENVPSLALLLWTGRHDAGLSVRELARRASVPPSQVTRVEKGDIIRPSVGFLASVAAALAKPVEPLLYMAGHISDEEFDQLTAGWRATLEDVEAAFSVVSGFLEDGRRDVAAQGAFFGPGAAEIAASMLSLGGQGEERELRDLLGMWQAMTAVRRRALLSFAADQERLSVLDRRDAEPGRYRVAVTLEDR